MSRLLIGTFVVGLSGCATLAAPARIASLGAPADLERGEGELIGAAMYRAPSGAIGSGEGGDAVSGTFLLGGTGRWAVGDRVALDAGAEVVSNVEGPFLIMTSFGPRYTTDPKRDARRAVWFDVEAGVGAGFYAVADGMFTGAVYAGAGVGARFGRFTAFGRLRTQFAAGGAEVADGLYHTIALGAQHPVSPNIALYGATGLGVIQGSLFGPDPYYAAGPYWLHADLGVRVRWKREPR